jgi:Epoxide hydrolase N terminus
MDTIEEFRIKIPRADLDDLRERLARTRWPDQLPMEEPGLLVGDGREFFRLFR